MRNVKNITSKFMITMAAAAMAAGCMMGCGSAQTPETVETAAPAAETAETATPAAETVETTAPAAEIAAPAAEAAETTAPAAETEEDAYTRFLKGDGTVSWASYLTSGDAGKEVYWDYTFKDYFDQEKAYTYDEFVEGVLQAENDGDGMTGDPGDVQYAILDLQGSGVQALALKVVMEDAGGTPEYQIFVLKDNGKDSLDIAFTRAYGYRAIGVLDEYGFYYSYGSTAGLHDITVETVDPEGVYHFLYGIEDDIGIYMLTQDEAIMKEAEDAGIQLKIMGRRVVTESDDFADLSSGSWNYYMLNDEEEITPDESIYEEGNIYRTIWNEIGYERIDEARMNEIATQSCIDNGLDEALVTGRGIIRMPDSDSAADEVAWTKVR